MNVFGSKYIYQLFFPNFEFGMTHEDYYFSPLNKLHKVQMLSLIRDKAHIYQGSTPDLEAQGKRYEKSKTGEPLAPEKGLMPFKIHF